MSGRRYVVQVRRVDAAQWKGNSSKKHCAIVWGKWRTVAKWPHDTDPEQIVRSLQGLVTYGTTTVGRVKVGAEILAWGDHRGVWVTEGTSFHESVAHLLEGAQA